MKFNCPHCNQPIEAQDDWAGMSANCPTCRNTIAIPLPESSGSDASVGGYSPPVRPQSIPPVIAASPTVSSVPQPCGDHAADQRTNKLAIASLVLGILSLPCAFSYLGIPAVILGHLAQSQIRKSEGRAKGDGLARKGIVMGRIGCVGFLLLFVFLNFYLIKFKGQHSTSHAPVSIATMIAGWLTVLSLIILSIVRSPRLSPPMLSVFMPDLPPAVSALAANKKTWAWAVVILVIGYGLSALGEKAKLAEEREKQVMDNEWKPIIERHLKYGLNPSQDQLIDSSRIRKADDISPNKKFRKKYVCVFLYDNNVGASIYKQTPFTYKLESSGIVSALPWSYPDLFVSSRQAAATLIVGRKHEATTWIRGYKRATRTPVYESSYSYYVTFIDLASMEVSPTLVVCHEVTQGTGTWAFPNEMSRIITLLNQ